MHSPNWIDDPTLETVNYWSDWEYYSDDYFDEVGIPGKSSPAKSKDGNRTRTGKRKAEDNKGPRKRQRLHWNTPDVELSRLELEILQRPSIVWRSSSTSLSSLPKTEGLTTSVAFLKNWADLPSPTWVLSFDDTNKDKIMESIDKKPGKGREPNSVDHSLSLRQDSRGSTKDTQELVRDTQGNPSASQDSGSPSVPTQTPTSKSSAIRGTASKRKNQMSEDSMDDLDNMGTSKRKRIDSTGKRDRPIATTKTTRSGKVRD